MDTKWIKTQRCSRIYKYFSASNENIIFMELEKRSLIICSVSMAFILGVPELLNKNKVSIIVILKEMDE